MQKDNRRIGAFLLAFIYLLAIQFMAQQTIPVDYTDTQKTDQQQYFTAVSSGFFSHTAQSDENLNLLKNQLFNFKADWKIVPAISFAIENFRAKQFVQYKTFFLNLRINFKRALLLYPFHHFW